MQTDKENNRIGRYFTKILLAIILFLSSLIYVSFGNNKEVFQKKFLDNTFDFMAFKQKYEKYFGKIIKNEDKMVMNSFLEYKSVEKYLSGQKYLIENNLNIPCIEGGIVVYSGQKEGFNNTVIIQGSNGYDFWYGNLDNVNVTIYDYVDESKIIGDASEEFYLQIVKDEKYYTYEEYQNQD